MLVLPVLKLGQTCVLASDTHLLHAVGGFLVLLHSHA